MTYAEPGRAVKPDPEPFDRALSALGVTPTETVHVGDSLRSDVAGARAAGVTPVWFERTDRSPSPPPAYSIGSLHDPRSPPLVGAAQPSHSSNSP